MVYLDAYWKGCYCYCRVEYLRHPESHETPTAAETTVMKNFNSYGISRFLWFYQSALSSISTHWIIIIRGPCIKDTSHQLSCLLIASKVVSKESISLTVNSWELNKNSWVHSAMIKGIDHSTSQLKLELEHVLNSHIIYCWINIEISKTRRKNSVVERLLLNLSVRTIQKL